MPRRILIVKLSSIGDVVHALPAAHSLRIGFPDAYLCWAVHKSCRDVVEGNRYLDDVFVIEDKSLTGIWEAGGQLAERKFDTAIDMQGLFRSGLLAWRSGARERIGFSGKQEMHHIFLTRAAVEPGYARAAPYCQMEFAVAAGGPRIEPAPEIFVSAESRSTAARLLSELPTGGGPIVAVNPGAAWKTKRWSVENYAETADQLVKLLEARIIITGGPDDAAAADKIAAAMTTSPLRLAGRTTLKELAAVFQQSALYVGGDTGPMHIAAAVGTPIVAVFGPTHPDRTGPVGSPSRVIRHAVPCGPCRLRECSHHTCMKLVTPDQVVAAAYELLTAPRTSLSRPTSSGLRLPLL